MVTERLAAAGCVAPDEEANELVAAAPDDATLEGWILRREEGEPLAWIVGSVQFCGRTVLVDPGVYVPRFETQELARRAAAVLSTSPGGRGADLCTGSGAVAFHMQAEVPAATVIGVDIDERSVRSARRNQVRGVVGDVGSPALRSGAFDVVTAVTPYVPTEALRLLPSDVLRHEPRRALDGGPDGLDLARRAVLAAAGLLRPGGWLLTEVGGEQDGPLTATLNQVGFGPVATWRDEDGDLRGLAAQLLAV
jgi:release factor glutamine methyltransferase